MAAKRRPTGKKKKKAKATRRRMPDPGTPTSEADRDVVRDYARGIWGIEDCMCSGAVTHLHELEELGAVLTGERGFEALYSDLLSSAVAEHLDGLYEVPCVAEHDLEWRVRTLKEDFPRLVGGLRRFLLGLVHDAFFGFPFEDDRGSVWEPLCWCEGAVDDGRDSANEKSDDVADPMLVAAAAYRVRGRLLSTDGAEAYRAPDGGKLVLVDGFWFGRAERDADLELSSLL